MDMIDMFYSVMVDFFFIVKNIGCCLFIIISYTINFVNTIFLKKTIIY